MADLPTFRIAVTDTAAHLLMNQREHDTNGLSCWCGPDFFLPCDECDAGCWRCVDGLIRLTAEAAAAEDRPLLIVHK